MGLNPVTALNISFNPSNHALGVFGWKLMKGGVEMKSTVIVAASLGTWISVCFSYFSFFLLYFFFQNKKEISQDWVFFSKDKMASMLLSRQLTCCLQQNSRLLVFGKCFLAFSCFIFGKCFLAFFCFVFGVNLVLMDRSLIWTLLGFVLCCWVFQNWRNMMFCILDNNAVVVQSGPQL